MKSSTPIVYPNKFEEALALLKLYEDVRMWHCLPYQEALVEWGFVINNKTFIFNDDKQGHTLWAMYHIIQQWRSAARADYAILDRVEGEGTFNGI